MRLISVRKLAALDMALHGKWLIFAEFLAGVLGAFILLFLLYTQLNIFWKLWLMGVGMNYMSLLWFVLCFLRKNNYGLVAQSVLLSPARRQFTWQQWLILIPFLILSIAIIQESYRSHRKSESMSESDSSG